MKALHLVFDADDTLWENNVYFEEAFEQFYTYLAHSSLSPDQVRAVLDEIEVVNARVHGYGSRNFARNLSECFKHLSEREVSARDLDAVCEFAYQILDRPPELIPGVEDTLAYLCDRHSLLLFTKGDPDEQRMKDRSIGVRPLFSTRRYRQGKKRAGVPGSCLRPGMRVGTHVHDRQLAKIGH